MYVCTVCTCACMYMCIYVQVYMYIHNYVFNSGHSSPRKLGDVHSLSVLGASVW